ncbi:hypothetical protein [Kutzneria albida]|uniref:hypothetical protein n=1 Tax=Kutzneria albida TaxID=43357 RepID=UPI0006910AAD|nr:hypothetical protein [Kutzneria albida]
MGHSIQHIALLLGHSHGRSLHKVFGRSTVSIKTAQSIAALYDQLSMTCGPHARTRELAEQAGWPPPLAWDDDTIDNPSAQPDLGATASRRGMPKIDVQDARALLSYGVQHDHVAELFGVTEASLDTALRRSSQHNQSTAA